MANKYRRLFKNVQQKIKKNALAITGIVLIIQGVVMFQIYRNSVNDEASAFTYTQIDSITPSNITTDVGGNITIRGKNLGKAENIQISSGIGHTCILREAIEGEVLCWGKNTLGQLGTGDNVSVGDAPVGLSTLDTIDFGTNLNPKLLTSGNEFNCVVFEDNSIKCWGENTGGHIMRESNNEPFSGTFINNPASAAFMKFNNANVDDPNTQALRTDEDIIEIAAGERHVCFVTNLFRVNCWGSNDEGQLLAVNDNGVKINNTQFGQFNDFSGMLIDPDNPVDIEVRGKNSCIASIFRFVCWGDDGNNQAMNYHFAAENNFGDETYEIDSLEGLYTELPSTDRVKDIEIGSNSGCVLATVNDSLTETEIRCWGDVIYDGTNNIIGDQSSEDYSTLPVAALPNGFEEADDIEMGDGWLCIKADNKVSCVGENAQGQLGLGTNTTDITGNDNEFTVAEDITLMSGNHDHSCLVMDQDIVLESGIICWGDNATGQLGLGNTNPVGDNESPSGQSQLVTESNPVINIENNPNSSSDDLPCLNVVYTYNATFGKQVNCDVQPTNDNYFGINEVQLLNRYDDEPTRGEFISDPAQMDDATDLANANVTCEDYLDAHNTTCLITPPQGFIANQNLFLKVVSDGDPSPEIYAAGGDCATPTAANEPITCTDVPVYDTTAQNTANIFIELQSIEDIDTQENANKQEPQQVSSANLQDGFCDEAIVSLGDVIADCKFPLDGGKYNFYTLGSSSYQAKIRNGSSTGSCVLENNGSNTLSLPAYLTCSNIPVGFFDDINGAGSNIVNPVIDGIDIFDVQADAVLRATEIVNPSDNSFQPSCLIDAFTSSAHQTFYNRCTFSIPKSVIIPQEFKLFIGWDNNSTLGDFAFAPDYDPAKNYCSLQGGTDEDRNYFICPYIPGEIDNFETGDLAVYATTDGSNFFKTTVSFPRSDATAIELNNIAPSSPAAFFSHYCNKQYIIPGTPIDCTFKLQGDSNNLYKMTSTDDFTAVLDGLNDPATGDCEIINNGTTDARIQCKNINTTSVDVNNTTGYTPKIIFGDTGQAGPFDEQTIGVLVRGFNSEFNATDLASTTPDCLANTGRTAACELVGLTATKAIPPTIQMAIDYLSPTKNPPSTPVFTLETVNCRQSGQVLECGDIPVLPHLNESSSNAMKLNIAVIDSGSNNTTDDVVIPDPVDSVNKPKIIDNGSFSFLRNCSASSVVVGDIIEYCDFTLSGDDFFIEYDEWVSSANTTRLRAGFENTTISDNCYVIEESQFPQNGSNNVLRCENIDTSELLNLTN